MNIKNKRFYFIQIIDLKYVICYENKSLDFFLVK